MKTIYLVTILVLIPSAAYSQEKSEPRTYTPLFHEVEPTDAMRDQMQDARSLMRYTSKAMSSGRNQILENLTIDDLDTLSDLPLNDDQMSKLREIMKSYQDSVAGLQYSDPSHRYALLAEKKLHLEKIEEVLLPEQIKSIAEKTRGQRRLISKIVGSKLGREVNLTVEQKEQLIDEAVLINEQIQASMAEVKRLTAKHQQSVLDACKRVLSKEQLAILDRKVKQGVLVKTMSLQDLLIDTKLSK